MRAAKPPFLRAPVMAWCAAALTVAVLVAPAQAQTAEPAFSPASKVGLVPPPGFVPSATFPGFQHKEKQASILVAELPGYAFATIEKEITEELTKNPAAATRRELELKDGARGFVLKAVQTGPQGEMHKWTMVATAHDVTALVTALIPEAVKEVASDEAVIASFSSIRIRGAVPVEEQLSVLPFALANLAGFRIVRVQPGAAAMLTDGPKDAIEITEQPLMLIAIAALGTQPRAEERDSFARRIIGETPGVKDIRVARSEPLRIANQQGHEILIEAKDIKSETDVKAVQWLRFGSGTLLRIFAIARKDAWDGLYPRFRQVRDGIGPK